MSKNTKQNNCKCNCSSGLSIASGNSLDVDVNYCESEIRADIVVSEFKSVRLWGRVVNCEGKPVSNALVKLLKVICDGSCMYYQGVAHTISDCDGFYQFELCSCDEDGETPCYKVLVSKAAYGPERVIPYANGNCNPCDPCDGYPFDPCREYDPIIAKPGEVGLGGQCCDNNSECYNEKTNRRPRR
ncbi:hypothetical protein [Romboutsia sp.]|uniref:hypothetical protein n=1 Tax=Romboutsia sp. TaxID=1965302 RepID=UPI003F3B2D60